jgi:hypothetical protein
MWNKTIHELTAHILKYNTYFNKGFSNAFQDEETGIVWGKDDNKDLLKIFPNDALGNYFYMRPQPKGSFVSMPEVKMSDTRPGLGLTNQITLVAVVKNANADILLNNLISSVQAFSQSYITLNSWIAQTELVIVNELSKLKDKAEIEAALQRIKPDQKIVALLFTIGAPYTYYALNCLPNPCTSCS